MKKEIIINASKDRSRIAIVEDGELVELYVENPENVRTIGNIYLGEVQKVMPAIRAAFVDLGEKQDAFLHFSDLTENAAQLFAMAGEDVPGLEAPVLARAPQKRVADDENEPDVEEKLEIESGDGESSSSRTRRSSRSRRGRGRGRGRGRRREEEEEQEERRRGMVIDLTSGAQKKETRASRPTPAETNDAADPAPADEKPSRSRRSPKRSEADTAPDTKAPEAKMPETDEPSTRDAEASSSEPRPRRRSRSRGRSRSTTDDNTTTRDSDETPSAEAEAPSTEAPSADTARAEDDAQDDAPRPARSRSRRRGTDSDGDAPSPSNANADEAKDDDESSRPRSRRGGRRGGSSRRDASRDEDQTEATSDDEAPRASAADSNPDADDDAPKPARSRSRRRSRSRDDSSAGDDATEAKAADAPKDDAKTEGAPKADAKPKRSTRRGPAVVDLTSSAKPKPAPPAKRDAEDAEDEEGADDTSRSRRGGRRRSRESDASADTDASSTRDAQDGDADESSDDRSGRRRSRSRSRSSDDSSDSGRGRGRGRKRDDESSDDTADEPSGRSRRGRSKDADEAGDSGDGDSSRGRRRSRSDADASDDASSDRGRRASRDDDDAEGSRSRSSDRSRGSRGRDAGRGRSGGRGGRGSSSANQNVPPPQELLKRGSRVLVKVTKEPISSKGSRVSTDISLAGRFLVLVPAADYIAVSKKIESSKERRRLKSLAQSLKPDDCGVIVRTVAEGRDAKSLDTDLRLLIEKWDGIKAGLEGRPKPPKTLYTDVNMVSSIIRDLFSEDFDRIYVDDPKVFKNVQAYVQAVAPDMADNVQLHKSKTPVYRSLGLEKQVEEAFSRRVNMKGGGYLFIETTEAMHVVDVNSGRAGRGKSQKENLMAVNLEAAREVAKQLRLRDLGGIIVVDFIDLRHESDRRKVTDELKKAFKRDRAVTKLLPMSDFGLVQITRQRLRPSITAQTTDDEGQPLDAADAAAAAGAGEIPQSSRRDYVEDEPEAAAPAQPARASVPAEEATPSALATRIRGWLAHYRDAVDDRYRGRPIVIRVHPLLGEFLRRGFISTLTKWRLGLRGIAFRVEEDASVDPLTFDVRDEKSGRSLLSKYSA